MNSLFFFIVQFKTGWGSCIYLCLLVRVAMRFEWDDVYKTLSAP